MMPDDIPHIPRYTIQSEIGSGSMAVVYLALDRLTQQPVALKLLKLSSLSDDKRSSLAHEFQTLASLRHPYIVSVLTYGFASDGTPFFAMDYLPNTQTFMQAGQGQPLEVQIRLILQLLEALAYLHRRGILHHDLKPGNILVVNNMVQVVDFGLSRLISRDQVSQSSGTLAYMPPEVLRKQSMTTRGELFAVGLMTYEMLKGAYPFPLSPAIAVINGILNIELDFSQFGLPDQVMAVLQRLVMKPPDLRYQSAQAVIDDLREALSIQQANIPIRESYLQAASFVGRQAELDQLQTALMDIRQGHSQIWLLGGESGVGKTRLVHEFRVQALIQGFEVLSGQEVRGSSLSFQIWREPVRHLLLSRPVNDLQAGILKEIVPDIEQLLGRPVATIPPLEGVAHQERLIFSIIDLLQHQQTSLLFILEDLQWTTDSLGVIKTILNELDQLSAVMILGTYRNEERPDLPQELPGVRTLTLERLHDDEVNQLSQAMLGEQGTDPQLVSQLIQETEGNTFFIVEVMRTWIEESGSFQQVGDGPLSTNILTSGMHNLLQRRIQLVSSDDQRLLQLAAIAGQQLDMNIIAALAQQDVASWLQRISDVAILTVSEGQWQFAHDKVRETILQELTHTNTRTLHQQIAETIENVYPDNPDHYPILLELWRQAGIIEKEIYYLIPVVENMIEVISDYDQAQQLLERGAQIVERQDHRLVSIWNWQSLSYIYQGRYEETYQLSQQALELARRIDDQPGIARSALNLANVTYQMGDRRAALDFYQTGLTIYNVLGDQQGTIIVLNMLGTVEADTGRYRQASEYCLQGLAIAQDIGDQRGSAQLQNTLAIIAYRQGSFAEAAEYCLQGLAIAQDIGDQRNLAKSLSMLGLIRARQGEYVQGRADVEQSILMLQKIGNRHQLGYSIATLGVIEALQDGYATAREILEQSQSIFEANNNQHGIANTVTYLGFVYLKLNNMEQARVAFSKALAISQTNRFIPFILRILLGFGWIYLAKGQGFQAAKLSGLVQAHLIITFELKLRLDELTSELEQALDPADLQAALDQGKTLDLETIVNEILTDDA